MSLRKYWDKFINLVTFCPIMVTAALILGAVLFVVLVSGCQPAPAKTKLDAGSVQHERYEEGPIRRSFKLRRAPEKTPSFSPDLGAFSHLVLADIPPVQGGFSEAAKAAIEHLRPGDEIEYDEQYGSVLDAKGSAIGGSGETSGDDTEVLGRLTVPGVDIAPMGSKKISGSDEAASRFEASVKGIAAAPTTFMIFGGLLIAGGLACAFYPPLAPFRMLGVGIALAGGLVIMAATNQALFNIGMLGAIVVVLIFMIPTLRTALQQRFALGTIVAHVEKHSLPTNPGPGYARPVGNELKRTMDEELDAETLTRIDKAIDPLKAGA